MGQNPEALGSTVPLQGGSAATPPPPVVASAPVGYVQGCRLAWVSVNRVSVDAGLVRSSDDTFNITVPALLTADITVAGANGLDAGVEAPSTWYAVYVIADSTAVNPVASLLSTSFVAPVLPAGYDKFRRVGCVRNNAASNFMFFVQVWNETTRRYSYEDTNFVLSGVPVTGVYAAVSLTDFVPPSSFNVLLSAFILAGIGVPSLAVRTAGSTNTPPVKIQTAAGEATEQFETPCGPSQIIEWITAGPGVASFFLNVVGFDDEI